MESLLSLSDVELGMEEHAGDTEDIDYHKRKIKRRVSVVLKDANSVDYLSLPIPNLRDNHSIACSGKPNSSKRQILYM